MAEEKKPDDEDKLEISYRESEGRDSIKNQLSSKKDSLKNLAGDDKALFVALDELNDGDLKKLKSFLDSLDHEPIFIAADQATCD
jgi:hypothetical protein